MSGPSKSPGSPWNAVLFDLDGTLADTVPLILASYRHAVTKLRGGWDEEGQQAWRDYIGRPLRDAVRDFGRDEADSEALLAEYLAFQREAHDRMVSPFPGVHEMVSKLEARKVPQALVTSKARRPALRTLDVCGFAGTFPVLITADEVERGKPDPEAVVLALEQLGQEDAGSSVFVGDSPHDIAAGRAAGVATIGVTWGAFPAEVLRASAPTHLVESVPELMALVTAP